jgi:hypothetical protein
LSNSSVYRICSDTIRKVRNKVEPPGGFEPPTY